MLRGLKGRLRYLMALFTQSSFTAAGIHSLCWRGHQLVDWVGGGRAFAMDGTEQRAKVRYAYRFDAATTSPDGRFAVIYERLGTKGLLLRDGQVLRELNRSFYQAHAYEYPVALFDAPDGRVLLAHCPEAYNCLELEDAETGRSLTAAADRKLTDFFYSRLAASPDGRRLLSAGWVWHPLSQVVCFDVAQALAEPQHLDRGYEFPRLVNPGLVEENSACWLDNNRIAIATSVEEEQDDIDPHVRLGLAVYDVADRTCLRAFQLEEPAGTIIPLGTRYVLSLYRHPKAIDLSTGQVVHVWNELQSGLQDGSIFMGLGDEANPPPMAFDPASQRFAVVNRDTVTVIQFNSAALRSD